MWRPGGRPIAPCRLRRHGRRVWHLLTCSRTTTALRGTGHARSDAGRTAHAAALLRPGRDAVLRQGGRHRHRHRASSAPPTATGPSAPAGSAACSTTSASATTAGSPPSPGTPPATSSSTSPSPCTGRVLHTLNIRLFPEQLVYIVNHAEDEVIFVDRSLIGLLGRCVDQFETVRHIVVMDDGKGEVPEPRRRPGAPRLRGPAGRAPSRSSSTSTTRTAPRRCATRAAPPATRRASSTPTARRTCTRWVPWRPTASACSESDVILPVVPMFHANAWGLAHAAVAAGRHAGHARPRPVAARHRQAHRGGAGHGRGRRAHDLDGRAARAEGPRHVGAAGHPVRRLGRAPGAVGGLPRADRPADHAGVGHDRDQPDRVGRPHQVHARRRRSTTTSRPTCAPRVGQPSIGVDFRIVDPGSTEALPVGRRELRRAAGARARGSRPSTTTTTARRSRSPTTAG